MEFTLVRDFVRDALLEVCSQVQVDTEKSVLKQAAVQHLYGRLSGTLQPHANDAQLLVTPPAPPPPKLVCDDDSCLPRQALLMMTPPAACYSPIDIVEVILCTGGVASNTCRVWSS